MRAEGAWRLESAVHPAGDELELDALAAIGALVAVGEESAVVLAGALEELRALGAGEAPFKIEKEEVVTNHASEEKGSQSVQGGALLQQTEALFVPGEDVEVGAAWRVCGCWVSRRRICTQFHLRTPIRSAASMARWTAETSS